ncbi:hypothetical protein CHS0354_040087 [Potamilus streckersoni]|uniref:Uncharacterized protein n=1 Tax=Potamilus streckersoni TaxID=2493646 RepID=A0AAE0STA7_9BIVA|nr:hypothetical protein CHS0354_040087 [Potamilus streckersoni]
METTAVRPPMDSASSAVILDGGEKLAGKVVIKEHTGTDVMKHVAGALKGTIAVQRLMDSARWAVKLDGLGKRVNMACIIP